jgi:hypothetical protein
LSSANGSLKQAKGTLQNLTVLKKNAYSIKKGTIAARQQSPLHDQNY